jgi:hypothetical protein
MGHINAGCLTRKVLDRLIAKHVQDRNVRALKHLHTVIVDRAHQAERMGWGALADSWTRDAMRVKAAISSIASAGAAKEERVAA